MESVKGAGLKDDGGFAQWFHGLITRHDAEKRLEGCMYVNSPLSLVDSDDSVNIARTCSPLHRLGVNGATKNLRLQLHGTVCDKVEVLLFSLRVCSRLRSRSPVC
jgi:hypothetical protein